MDSKYVLEDYLIDGNLCRILPVLKKKVELIGDWELKEDFERTEETYKSMLRFSVMGYDDSDNSKMRTELVKTAHEIYNKAKRLEKIKTTPNNIYSVTLKSLRDDSLLENIELELNYIGKELNELKSNKENLSSLDITYKIDDLESRHEIALLKLFNRVWTSGHWTNSDYNIATRILGSNEIDDKDKALLVSAVTFSLLEYIDEKKLMFLFDAYQYSSLEVNQRAIVGITIILRIHDRLIEPYTEVIARFKLFIENAQFIKDLYAILIQLQLSKMTDRVSDKMKNDIIPSIMESKNLKNTFNLNEEMTKNDENPDWFKSFDSGKASEKIKEMTEMQIEGSDVYMSTFSHMKAYPFFHTLAHWLYPFYPNNPSLKNLRGEIDGEKKNIVSIILHTTPFCSSDKYSFCFMLETAGVLGKNMIFNEMMSKFGDIDKSELLEEAMNYKPKKTDISRSYIFDLYRLFNIYSYRKDIANNPFKVPEDSFTPLATDLFISNAINGVYSEILALAELFMRKGMYEEALDLFYITEPRKDEESADLWQKIGFCEEKLNKIDDAYKAYVYADELKPLSKWTLRHRTYMAFKKPLYDDVVACCQQLVSIDSENELKWTTLEAEGYMKMKNFENATPLLYKCLYLQEDSDKTKDSLAWCLIMTGKTDKALQQLINIKENTEDNQYISYKMDLGHCYLISGNKEKALEMYKEAYELIEKSSLNKNNEEEDNIEIFMELFESRHSDIHSLGFSHNELYLIREAVVAKI